MYLLAILIANEPLRSLVLFRRQALCHVRDCRRRRIETNAPEVAAR